MNWPQIPESFEGMDSAALRALIDSIHAARAANLPNLTAEDEAEYDRFTNLERRLRTLAVDAEASEREAAERERQAQASTDPDPVDPDPEDPPADPDDDPADPDASGGGGQQLAVVGAGAAQTSMSTGATRVVERDRRAARWVSTGIAHDGPARGSNFGSNLELAEAIMSMNSVVEAGSDVKHHLGKIYANHEPQYVLDENKPWTTIQNLLDGTPEEIEAAWCPPATPIYDLACENSTRRPVLTGLPGFRTPERGAFTVLASPTLASITTGHGQWTSSDDANPSATKTCQTVSCVTSSTYEIYGIYRCLTVKNFMNALFPELVAAYLNRLQAASAREAEILMLEAMSTGSTSISAPALGYNGTVTLQSTILTYLGLYMDIERWDAPMMDAWMPRWVQWAIKTDLIRRRNDSGRPQPVPSDAEVDSLFTSAGVQPHWFMDRPSWAVAFSGTNSILGGGVMKYFPSFVDILVHKRGKFATMTREISIGVTGNNIYRVSDDLLKNQFTFFVETAEGVINTDSCPAHKIRVPACWNGVQIADVAIDCEGNDYSGIGS